jgi:hypothetical protein
MENLFLLFQKHRNESQKKAAVEHRKAKSKTAGITGNF